MKENSYFRFCGLQHRNVDCSHISILKLTPPLPNRRKTTDDDDVKQKSHVVKEQTYKNRNVAQK